MSKPLPPALQATADQQIAELSGMVDTGVVKPTYPFPTSSAVLSDQKVEREATTSTADYAKAAWRQDVPLDGLVGWYAGSQMVDDPTYNVWADPRWEEVDNEISTDYHPWLAEAKSAAQFDYIRSRIRDKQDDLQKLGDLGVLGTAGRFALGVADPTMLLSGYVGGIVYKGYQASRLSRAAAAVKATTGAANTRAVGGLVAEASRAPSITAGVASAAAQNVAYEKLRQSVNFEDSTAQLVEAALFGAAISAPFIAGFTRQQRRIANAARREQEALHLLADAQEGKALTPEQQTYVVDVLEGADMIRRVEQGAMSPDEFLAWAKKGLAPLDESITLGGTVKSPKVTTDAPKAPSAAGLEVVDTAVDNVDAAPPPRELNDPDVPSTEGLQVDEVADPRGVEVEEKGFEDFFKLSAPEAPANPAMADKLREALGVAEQKKAEADTAVQKEAAFAKAEQDAALNKERDFTAAEAQRDLQAAVDEGELTPVGFLAKGSIGSGAREMVESTADAATWADKKLARVNLNGKEYYIPSRLDIYATLNRSDNVMVRRLAYDLVKDPIQNDANYAQAMTASEWKSHYRRTFMGGFFTVAREARLEAAKVRGKRFWGREDFTHQFNDLTTRVTRGGVVAEEVLAANADIAPMLKKASAAQKEFYGKFLEELKAAGVKGADQVDVNSFYVNRIWDHDMIRDVGEERAIDIIAASVKDPELRGDRAAAAKFVQTIMSLEYSPLLREISAGAADMAYVRAQLLKAGIPDEDIEDTISTLLKHDPRTDTGRAPSMKYRWDLDETVQVNGKSVSDLTENDSFLLADLYANSMGGHLGLAKVGIRSSEDWGVRMKEVSDYHKAKGGDVARLKRDQQLLEDIYANITGRPMGTHDFSPSARLASVTRAYTRSTVLGMLGWTAAWEMKQTLALSTARAVFSQSPTLTKVLGALAKGFIPEDRLARDIQAFAGFGNEIAMSYMRDMEVGEFGMEMGLTKIERFANKASHITDVVGGNRNITSLTRNWSGKAMIQKHVDWAADPSKIRESDITRLVGQGLNRDDIEGVLKDLREYVVVDGHGIVKEFDYARWKAEKPGTHDMYLTAFQREVRDAIQDPDLGETMPWMHTTIGKIFGELKSFMFVAHAKNFLKNISHGGLADVRAWQVFTISYVGEMLSYALQQAITYGHDENKLKDKLTPGNVALAAFGRSSSMGITPFFVGSGTKLLTGQDPFTGLTANTGNRSFLPPSVSTIQNFMAVPGTAADALTGRGVTEGEAKAVFKTLPLNNMAGARNISDILSSMQPKTAE